MIPQRIKLILAVTFAFGIACEGSGPTEFVTEIPRPPRDPSVFTTLQIFPSTVAVYEGLTVQLQVYARDQRGESMASTSANTFSSSDPSVATVSNTGLVTGLAAGTVDISVTETVGGVTRTALVKTTVLDATPLLSVVLRADSLRGWQPSVAFLAVGGTVTWVTDRPISWSSVPHRMLYLLDPQYTVVDSLDLSTGSATRKFETPGKYNYCSAGCWDPPDYGVVYVH